MVARIHVLPQCPECSRRNSKVVLTKEVINGEFDVVRRRHCLACGHRWYTAQTREISVHNVEWADHGTVVNWVHV